MEIEVGKNSLWRQDVTIRKKLYLGFGSIVVILILLFVVNATVVLRERARSSVQARR